MARKVISGGGSFTSKNISDINANYTELYAGTSGQSLTSPTIITPTLTGAVAGTYTLGGTPTITAPAITSPTITGTPVINTIKGNFSTSTVSGGYGSDTYLAGSAIAIPAGGWVAGGTYTCVFDMVKTNAGSAAFTITLRIGTGGGVVGDTSIMTWAFGNGTAAVDSGIFTVTAQFRTVGATTTAVIAGLAYCSHALAATGLISTGASGFGQVSTVSSGFDSTVAATTMGLSVNGGASFSGTNSVVQTNYRAY